MSTLLGPRDENGIPVPMTVDESIASMKASLLKKIKRSAYVYRVDCGAATVAKLKSSPPFRRCSTLNASGSRWCLRRAMPISCCLPGR
ncbi:formate hydrogenlyase subunit 7 [Klebsiella variicola]|nr:formate hydrogenlyase subunit 7 [Klebsiella variicola]